MPTAKLLFFFVILVRDQEVGDPNPCRGTMTIALCLNGKGHQRTVPKLCQNPIPLDVLGLLLSEKQIPQVVVNIKNRLYQMEPLEAMPIPWAQPDGFQSFF